MKENQENKAFQAFDDKDKPSPKIIEDCVHCGFCLPACPSGVRYHNLIEAARSQIERRYERSFSDRLFRSVLFSIFPYPERLRLLAPFLFLYQVTGIRRLLQSS